MRANTAIGSCQEIGTDDYREFVGKVFSDVSEVSIVEVAGKMCLCGSDSCDAINNDVINNDVINNDCDDVSIGPYWYVTCNTSVSMTLVLNVRMSLVGFRKDPFWVLYCLFYILMICVMYQC